jgi:hypothetical protein
MRAFLIFFLLLATSSPIYGQNRRTEKPNDDAYRQALTAQTEAINREADEVTKTREESRAATFGLFTMLALLVLILGGGVLVGAIRQGRLLRRLDEHLDFVEQSIEREAKRSERTQLLLAEIKDHLSAAVATNTNTQVDLDPRSA